MRKSRTHLQLTDEATSGTAALRVRNYTLILDDIRRSGPTSRADIAKHTGLSPATLSTLIPSLIAVGLVRDTPTDPTVARNQGRPTLPVEFDGTGYVVLAIQIGADDLVADWTDLAERPIGTSRQRHGGPGVKPQKLANDIAKIVQTVASTLSEHQRLASVMLVMDAPVQHDPNLVIISFDLEWPEPVALVDMVRRRLPDLSARIELVKDTTMATVAERNALENLHRTRIGELVYLKADTGVGGGVIINGELFNPNRIGFEPGHIVVKTNGRPCRCGRRGCLAAEADLDATLTRAGHADMIGRLGIAGATAALRDLVARKDPSTLRSLRQTGVALSAAVLDLSLVFDPIRVVLGGYWADVFEQLHIDYPGPFVRIGYLENQRHQALPNEHDYVLPGRLGEQAARTGSIRHAIDQLLSDPLTISNDMIGDG
jgi:predicted NBD/HSP70 family sugar kinase